MNQSQSPKEALKALVRGLSTTAFSAGYAYAGEPSARYTQITATMDKELDEIFSAIDQLEVPAEGWVNVEDRMPAVKERVMFWRPEGFCFGYRRDYSDSPTWADESYPDRDGDPAICWGVSHWQALPAAPKEPT